MNRRKQFKRPGPARPDRKAQVVAARKVADRLALLPQPMAGGWAAIEINPDTLPRSTTRAQWKAIHRSLRLWQGEIRRYLAAHKAEIDCAVHNAVLFGNGSFQIGSDP